ncbi:glycosyltransferase family 4 protein [Pedosphaera parvula]|uniref:Glycosyl transferase group 1 n=1 Tax=Pedosphaera parvula (strain Ellin514) TaxID=320771 RepID=B9XSD1_PEDPL|nr:glycosyltransferase family 4 protein [Pedosphaera parvula]EEF57264.1 glycosyl transferase group 1 [Pedosphaera parvula Ellin514]
MKLLVFAHTPPPHHGQSYMVQLMLDGFGGDHRRPGGRASLKPDQYGVKCYHVNAQVSKELEDIGDFRIGKLFLLIGFCFQAIWCHFRHGVNTMYYIPAPGKRSALYRDWIVMWLCRPFFKQIILHWHAAGMGKWLETHVQMREREFTYERFKNIDLSIVLSDYNRADAEKLLPQSIRVVSNGIPDPCPEFQEQILPLRRARFAARKKLAAGLVLSPDELKDAGHAPQIFNVFYLAHCTHEKGLFDAIQGVLLANRQLIRDGAPFTMELTVAGSFPEESEKEEFDLILSSPEGSQAIRYLGFLAGSEKKKALREADLFCFPTYYRNENQPVNLIEAMAFGLPILTTHWRSIPELLPSDYRCLVDIHSPRQIADALLTCLVGEQPEFFRELFLSNFTLEQYLSGLAEAFHSLELKDCASSTPALVPSIKTTTRPQ